MIDAWLRVCLVGIDLITVEARVVVSSIETYFKYSELLEQAAPLYVNATVAAGTLLGEEARLGPGPRRSITRRTFLQHEVILAAGANLALDKRCTPHELEAAVTALLAEKTHR